ncbi:Sbal_3080 family lipoprotein [Dyella mobilis]|uniref:Lipoprotein n=1 Tax=Dyella mobilis TaxID=1849582 RepID=A0ABS2KCL7_9GAMM|nr:Sbal_3080 family lipoprotein [Dyella mobilis]MBM7128925.1 hypothetical protein [Dyella mobilis]GLQ99385.1 hypothetical protein GCM10007863_38050 [Dyella mobilis]
MKNHKVRLAVRAWVLAVITGLLATGCTDVQVHPVDRDQSLSTICIVVNPAVEVSDFVDVLRAGIARHNLASQVVSQEASKICQATLTYTALRSWDMSPYLSYAELHLWRDGKPIGDATYHLRGKGGLSLEKWEGTSTKMNPVIDSLLSQYH